MFSRTREARQRQREAMADLAATDARTARLVEDVIAALGLDDQLPEAARALLLERRDIRSRITAEVPLPPALSYEEAVERNLDEIARWMLSAKSPEQKPSEDEIQP